MGFDARWGVLGAADVGANHQRDRIWIVGKATNSTGIRPHNEENQRVMESQRRGEFQSEQSRDTSQMANSKELFSNGGNDNTQIRLERETQSELRNDCGTENVSNTNSTQFQRRELPKRTESQNSLFGNSRWWETEPNVGRMADGVASSVDRLKAIGNGQVPLCAATAWRILSEP